MNQEELDRINRIWQEAVGDPDKMIRPKRIYPDDVFFLVEIIWGLLKEVDRLSKWVEPEEEK